MDGFVSFLSSAFSDLVWSLRRFAWESSVSTQNRRIEVAPESPLCPDYNASCIRNPCPLCLTYARPGCKRCSHGCDDYAKHQRTSNRTPVRWLHVPKCGATFALTVIRHACPEVSTVHAVYMALQGGQVDIRFGRAIGARFAVRGSRCAGKLKLPFIGHRPILARDTTIVAIFRRPAQRLISAFLDNYHAWGQPGRERSAMKAVAHTVHAFARYPGIAGCMAKMLAGRDCAVRLAGNDGALVLKKAISVLRSERIVFVGLRERWIESVCLFHRTVGGGSMPVEAEFRQLGHSMNSKREHANPYLVISDGFYNESLLGGFVDDLDEKVYAEAKVIFERNLQQCSAVRCYS